MSGLSLETYTPNLKSVALTVLELLAFNAQKFWGSRNPATPFSKKILKVMSGLSRTCVSHYEVRSFNRFGAISILRPNWSD